jgi:hypothetical protein
MIYFLHFMSTLGIIPAITLHMTVPLIVAFIYYILMRTRKGHGFKNRTGPAGSTGWTVNRVVIWSDSS